jgi:hypothetical protein
MRDTFRLSLLTAIILLFVTASGNLAFAASLEQSLNSQYPKGTVLNVVTPGLTGTTACDVYSQAAFKDGKLHAVGFVQKTALAAFKCELQPIEPGTQVNLTSMKVHENKVSFTVFHGQCAVSDCSQVVTGGASAQVDFEFPKGFLATATFAQLQDTIGHVFSTNGSPNAPEQEAQIAPPVSEPAPPAEETSIDPSAHAGAVSDQAKPVLDRAIRFLGGIGNIRAQRDNEGRLHETMFLPKGNLEIDLQWVMIYPGITRQDYKMSFGEKSASVSLFFDGTNGWMSQDGKVMDMNEDQKKDSRHNVFDEFSNLLSLIGGPTVTYEGKSGGNDVLLFRQEELSVRIHVDSTGQIVKRTYRGKIGNIEESLSDYREVDGVKAAYKVSATKNGQSYANVQIVEAFANTKPRLETLAQKPGGQPLSNAYFASIVPFKYPALYVSAQFPADHLQLNADNSFLLQESGQPYHGTFAIRGNTLLLNISESNIQTSLSRQGRDLADSSGQTWNWREQTATTAPNTPSPVRVRATGGGH